MSDERLRRIFLEETSATPEQLDKAAEIAERTGESLGSVLEMMGVVNSRQRVRCLALQLEVPFHDLQQDPPNPALAALVPREVQEKYRAVPVAVRVTLAFANPLGVFSVDDIKAETGLDVVAAIAPEEDVAAVIAQQGGPPGNASEPALDEEPAAAEEAPESEADAPAEAEPQPEPEPEPDVTPGPEPEIPEDLPSEVATFIGILQDETSVSKSDLAAAVERWSETGENVGVVLVRMGAITETERVRCQGKQWQIEFVDLAEFEPNAEVVSRVPRDQLTRNAALPVRLDDDEGVLYLAMANPMDVYVIDSIQVTTGYRVRALIALEADIRRLLAATEP